MPVTTSTGGRNWYGVRGTAGSLAYPGLGCTASAEAPSLPRAPTALIVKKHEQNKNMLEVTVEFVSEIISCVKDKDDKVISGDPEKIKKVLDTWKFSKDSRSSNPNWLLIDTQA